MYISTSAMSSSMRLSIMQSQQELATAQSELSSGTYADIGLSLGSTSGHLLSLTGQQSRLQAYTDSNTSATTRLGVTTSVLSSLQTTASDFLASLSTANTSGSSPSALQQTAKDNLSNLLAALNTTVGGQPVFGGINTAQVPMTPYTTSPASANKQAVDTAFQTAFGTSQTSTGAAAITADQMTSFLNGSFAGLFASGSYDATWSSASDQPQTSQISPSQTVTTSVTASDAVFRGLSQAYTMMSEFTGSTISTETQQAVVKSAVSVITTALEGLTSMQAAVGQSQNTIADATDRISAQTAVLSTASSGLTEVDPYTLNTRISSLQTQIEASYELTSSLQKLSLVNYFSS